MMLRQGALALAALALASGFVPLPLAYQCQQQCDEQRYWQGGHAR